MATKRQYIRKTEEQKQAIQLQQIVNRLNREQKRYDKLEKEMKQQEKQFEKLLEQETKLERKYIRNQKTLRKIEKKHEKEYVKALLSMSDDIFTHEYDTNIYRVQLFAHFETITKSKGDVVRKKKKSEAIDSFVVKGKAQIKDKVKEKEAYWRQHLKDEYYENKKIQEVFSHFTYEVSTVQPDHIPKSKVPMKNATTLRRDWLKYAEGICEQSYEDMEGQCVYELLIERLGNYWKTISKEKLFEIFNEYVQKNANYLNGAPFHGEFTMSSGVNTDMIRFLCDKKKITMYAFDGNENCFQKVVYNSNCNYKPIAYYCLDGHMYMVTDDKVVKSLASSQKAEKNVVVSSMLEDEKREIETREYVECASFAQALTMTNCVVYLDQANISDEVHEYIANTKSIPSVKVSNHKIVQMNLKKQKLSIVCDPSYTEQYSWKDIKQICDKNQIPFTNQKIGGLIATLRKNFYRPVRRFLDEDEKQKLTKDQNMKCNLCDKKCAKFEYDYVTPIALGGSNDILNFQALCKECHQQKTEQESGDFIKFDDIASTFNDEALKIVQSHAFKQWAFVEKLYRHENAIKGKTLHKIDHAKCRRNLVMYSQHDFPMFSVMDYPTVYDRSDIKVGCYFVQTTNYFPFRGNGWYPHTMVKEALVLDIISKDEITHQFLSSFTIKNDHFKAFTQHLIDNTKEAGLDKLIVNSMVGCWGIQRSEFESIKMTLDKYEASEEIIRDDVFVYSRHLIDNSTLYEIIERKVINKDDMYLPLYNQILAMEAMELYKLEQMILENGGKPLERNTDAILYSGKEINIDLFHWDAEQKVAKYRYDELTHLKVESVCKFKRTDEFTPALFEWNVYQESDDFDGLAHAICDSNEGCQINGVAGAGKTTLANKLIALIEANEKKCIKLAPTRKAASHIKGQTLHKYYLSLFLSNNYEKKILRQLKNTDYMIVDEISMVKEVFYRFLTLLKRYAPNLKFIIIGDFDQLKPVNDKYSGDYKNSPSIYHLCDGNKIVLEKCRRSDKALFELYDGVRRGTSAVDVSQFPLKQLTELNIAYTHATRKRVNKQCMDKFVGFNEFVFCSKLEGDDRTQNVKLFQGMPIVSYKNNDKMDIYNSEVFTIHQVNTDEHTFSIMVKDQLLTFQASDFKYMFFPAYCVTIHVSQGCTFDKPYTIYDWSYVNMDKSAKYVALSRGTSINNIQIKN
jgi:hypothetical protein